MNRRDLVAALIGVTTGFWAPSQEDGGGDNKFRNVSLIRLVANPNQFDGHRLRLAGYLDYNGVDRSVGLYVSESDGHNSIISNSIDLHLDSITAKKFVGHYVILDGTYHAPTGPGAEYLNGFLERISKLRTWGAGDLSA